MLKVLQVTGTMNRGGAEVMLMDILRNKPETIHFDFLINNPPDDLFREGVFDKEIHSYGCEIRHIGTQLRIGPLNYIRRFREIYNELQPDVIHIHLNAKCGIIALAAHLAGCRCIITHCHADIRFRGSFFSRFFGEIELFVQKILIALYANSWWGCSLVANKRLYWPWVRKKSIVINNAIDLDAFCNVAEDSITNLRLSYALPESTKIIGNVGRIVPHKNIAFMVDVMRELHDRGHDVAFVIVGRDDSPIYTETMRKRAKELRIADDRLLFLGERSDVPTVMHTFDVFVGPALKEGFGLVAVEAQAAAVPCVLYKGFPTVVDMRVGLCSFISNFSVTQWADVITESWNKPKEEKNRIHQCIRCFGFDAKENAKRVCDLYSLLISETR